MDGNVYALLVFSRHYVEVAVHLARISANKLATMFVCQLDGRRRFTGCRLASDDV